jgi:hypothetical protein
VVIKVLGKEHDPVRYREAETRGVVDRGKGPVAYPPESAPLDQTLLRRIAEVHGDQAAVIRAMHRRILLPRLHHHLRRHHRVVGQDLQAVGRGLQAAAAVVEVADNCGCVRFEELESI